MPVCHWSRPYAKAEKAPATRRTYETDFRLFRAWCERKAVGALPAIPETIAAYLTYEVEQGCKASTLSRRGRPYGMLISWPGWTRLLIKRV
jgi:site-specific recombinase XerD